MVKSTQIQPLFSYVLVSPSKTEKTLPSGLVLPDSVKDKPQVGTVMAIGNGKNCCDGDKCLDCSMVVKVGDSVVYKKWGGNELIVETESGKAEWMLIEQKDLMAIIK